MTTRDEVIKAAKAAKLSRFMLDTERCREELERFYAIAFKAGMEHAAEILDQAADGCADTNQQFALDLVSDTIREEAKK